MSTQLGVLATVFAAFGAFTVKAMLSEKHINARVQKQGGSMFLGHYPMEFAYWVLSPIGKLATTFKVSPNFFSWLCLTLGLVAGISAAVGEISLAGGLSILSALFDILDGMVARSRGIASDAGEVLDAAVDRYTEFFFLAGVCIYYRFEPWAMAVAMVALLGSFMVSYTQAKSEALQTKIPKGWMRRPERAAYLGTASFLSPLFTTWYEGTQANTMHYPLIVAMLVVGVFANATGVVRYQAMYAALKSNRKK